MKEGAEIQSYESENNSENLREKIIEKNFETISENADKKTGLFSAVNSKIDTPESRENHMKESWIRDTSWSLVLLAETIRNLEETDPQSEINFRMREFLRNDLLKVLHFLNQPRWLDRFNQRITDNGSFTSLSDDAPEVHMKQDGTECSWDQNQPESWGELLVVLGKVKEMGIVSKYSAEEMKIIKAITRYLVNIKPWKFAGAGMWEGLPGHSPSSRSNAIVISKGLDVISVLFQEDQSFQKQIKDTVLQSMKFAKEDINTDYTTPSGHPDGADLAMLVAMVLPDSEKTTLPFMKYVEDNRAKLQIGSLPGAIRYIGDIYKKGEFGEARWFLADPILAIGYFREARNEFKKGNIEKAKNYERLAQSRLDQALQISKQYNHDPDLFPELFIQRDPKKIKGKSNILEKNDGKRIVALEPLERSLVWNTALVMNANAEAMSVAKLNISGVPAHEYAHAA